MDAHPYFQISNAPGKLMICYLRRTNKFLRFRALLIKATKCKFLTKSIVPTPLIIFEVLGVPQL